MILNSDFLSVLEIPDDRVTRFINSLPNLSLVDRLPERNVSHVINQQPIQPAQIRTVQQPPMYMMYHPHTGYEVQPLTPATVPPQLTRHDQMPPIYPASYIRRG